jgi:hypothetical protein
MLKVPAKGQLSRATLAGRQKLTSPEARFWRIVLKKSFSLVTENSRGRWCVSLSFEVRDRINYRKNDRWRSHRFYSALQRLKSPMRYICEIFRAPRFSSFSTQSARSGLSAHETSRQSLPTSNLAWQPTYGQPPGDSRYFATSLFLVVKYHSHLKFNDGETTKNLA